MRGKKLLAAMVVSVAALVAPAAASAATFTVNTPADTTVVGGCVTDPLCSLRDAVGAANVSMDPEDRIELPAGNYLLSGKELVVTGAGQTTIHGAGARSTVINAGGASRVFQLTVAKAAIEGVTITGGAATARPGEETAGDGGGILVQSTEQLALNAVNVSGNVASLNGGGIAAPPESGKRTALTIANSTVSANRVTGGVLEGLGGGVYALGDLAITNSTITGNSVSNPGLNSGGGVLVGLDPVETKGSTASLLNTTIAGNSVAAGGVGGGFTIDNPTAGVATAFTVKNTLIAGNTANGATDCGTVIAATSTNNLSGDTSCRFTDPGSRQNANPLLGPLQNNGGQTDTLALQLGSPAIDAGTNVGCPATDQRGVSRPQGSACDIGAFEREVTPPPPTAANLRLKLKPKPKHPRPGHKFVFLLTLANRGPGAAPGVIVNGTAPAAATKIKGKKVNGKRPCKLAKPKGGKRKFTCRLGELPAAASRKLRIVVKLSPDAGGKLRAKARVRSAASDPQLKDNKAKATATVKPGR